MAGLRKLLPKITGKAGREIAEATGKSVAGASDNVFSKLRHLWKGSDEAVEAGAKSVETAGRELLESTLHKDFAGDFAMKVRELTNKIYQNLSGFEAEAVSTIKAGGNIRKLENMLKNPEQLSKLLSEDKGRSLGLRIPEDVLTGGKDSVIRYVQNYMGDSLPRLKQAEASLHYINRAKDILNQPDGLQQLKRLLDVERKQAGGFFGSGLERKIPELRDMMDKVDDVYKFDLTSASNADFLQKAINLKSDSPKLFELFIANPNNASRWTKMKNSTGYVGKMIKELDPRISLKRSLMGITPGDTAKRLGLGVATLGAGYGAVKVYNWFGNNNPAATAATSGNIESKLGALRVRGDGANIVRIVQSSLANITAISNKVNTGLSTENAAEITKEFISVVSVEIERLYRALESWEVVAQNSENPRLAMALKQDLEQLAYSIASGLNELGGNVAISPGIAGKGPMMSKPSVSISKVQSFLGVQATGRLDRTTIDKLKQLEREYQRRSDDDRWIGAFVVPESGHIISYDNLIKAQRLINKY